MARDWPERFGYPLLLLETFVDPQRFHGTIYSAATCAAKRVFVRPLHPTPEPACRAPFLIPGPHRGLHRREEDRQDLHRDRLRDDQAYPGHRRCRTDIGLESRSLDDRKRLPLHPGLELRRGPLHHPHRPRPHEHCRAALLRDRRHQVEVPRYRLPHHPTPGAQPPPGFRLPAHDRELPPPPAGPAGAGGLEQICRGVGACKDMGNRMVGGIIPPWGLHKRGKRNECHPPGLR